MKNTKDNKITVGIPFYDATNQNDLIASIDSILNQTLQPKTLHLIQDGPINKNLNKILNEYKSSYPELITLIVLPKKGLPFALNESIKQTDTTYYARMDADDIAFKERLEEQVNFLNNNNNIDILGAWAVEFKNDPFVKNGYINRTPDNYITITEHVHYRNPLVHPSVVFRMSVFKKLGFYNESLFTDQDLELWFRAIKNKVGISNLQKPLLYLRIINRQKKRSRIAAIKRQFFIRYSYNTYSFKLNILKLAAIVLRILPIGIRDFAYKHFRSYN